MLQQAQHPFEVADSGLNHIKAIPANAPNPLLDPGSSTQAGQQSNTSEFLKQNPEPELIQILNLSTERQ